MPLSKHHRCSTRRIIAAPPPLSHSLTASRQGHLSAKSRRLCFYPQFAGHGCVLNPVPWVLPQKSVPLIAHSSNIRGRPSSENGGSSLLSRCMGDARPPPPPLGKFVEGIHLR